MILVFLKKFNKIYENTIFLRSSFSDDILKVFYHENDVPKCPKCNTNKHIEWHCSYVRNICTVINSEIVRTPVEILRLRCTGCTDTHAILPDDVIPYSYYGKSFVMYCLKMYYLENKSVSDIVVTTNTYDKLIYKFLNKYSDEFLSLLFFLKVYLEIYLQADTPSKKVLNIICNIESFKDFLKDYFLSTNKVFLMRNRQNIITRKNLIGYHICKYMGFT